MWYHKHIGGERCPIVDTWWQTETGSILISPLPGVTPTKPGSATRPLPGIQADVVDEAGNSVPLGGGGYLVLKAPWPAMLRTIYGDDPDRYIATYWSKRLQGPVFHRRRRPARRGRLLLDHGPRRRRDERLGPSARHDGGRERAGQPPLGGRGRGRRRADDHQRAGDLAFVTLEGGIALRDAKLDDATSTWSGKDRRAGAARRRSSSPTTCPRPAAAKSCAGCCATSPRAAFVDNTTPWGVPLAGGE